MIAMERMNTNGLLRAIRVVLHERSSPVSLPLLSQVSEQTFELILRFSSL